MNDNKRNAAVRLRTWSLNSKVVRWGSAAMRPFAASTAATCWSTLDYAAGDPAHLASVDAFSAALYDVRNATVTSSRDGDVIAVVTGSGRRDAGRHVYVLRRRQRVPAAQRCHDDGVDAGACDDWLPVNNQHHVSSSHRYCQTDFSRPWLMNALLLNSRILAAAGPRLWKEISSRSAA